MSVGRVSSECKRFAHPDMASMLEMADAPFKEVIREMYNTTSMTPLIKEELKLKIQYRRLIEGKEELTVDPTPRTKVEPLSEDDIQMQTERRERNNLAARQYRTRLRHSQETVIDEYAETETSNKELKKTVRELEEEKETLIRILQQHRAECTMLPNKSMPAMKSSESIESPEFCAPVVYQDPYQSPEVTSPMSGESLYDICGSFSVNQPTPCNRCSFTELLIGGLQEELSNPILRPTACQDMFSEGTPSPKCYPTELPFNAYSNSQNCSPNAADDLCSPDFHTVLTYP